MAVRNSKSKLSQLHYQISNADYLLLSGIEVGAELEAGFTVSSKYNSTSVYQYVANFDITINRFPERPTINYNLGGTCSGIQQN